MSENTWSALSLPLHFTGVNEQVECDKHGVHYTFIREEQGEKVRYFCGHCICDALEGLTGTVKLADKSDV